MTSTAEALIENAYVARRSGDANAALGLYRRAARASEDSASRAHCLRHIGDLERDAGNLDEALETLREAEALYRESVSDSLALANTVRLIALITGEVERWREARGLYEYEHAAQETGYDLTAAFAECDRHLT
jgi:tetratricopeptide (TPR) repeat protein